MAGFDPNAFVADEDFDPVAFAGETEEEGGPESFLDPKKFKPSPQHRKLKNTGSISDVRRQLDPNQVRVARTFDEKLSATTGPVLSIVDRASLGGFSGLLGVAKRINELTGTTEPTLASRSLDEIENYRRENPTLSQYTDIPAYLGPGAPRAIAGAVERSIPAAVAPIQRAAAASMGTSGLIAGGESAVRGDEPTEVLRNTGEGTLGGLAVGVPAGIGATLIGRAAKAVLGSKGAQAREYLESRGQPLTAADTSDAAIGAAAQRTDQAVKNRMSAYKQEVASGPYAEEIASISPRDAGGYQEVSHVWQNLLQASQDPANLRVADKLKTLASMLESRQMTTPSGDKMILMTEQELNGLRQSLGGISGVGETRDPKLSPLQDAFRQVKGIVDEGPYAEANRRYSAGLKDVDESLDMVGLSRSYDVDEPITGNLRVASQRQGQNTVTAGADTERLNLEAFKAKHPDLANVIDAPEILRRQGDLSFNLQGHGHGGLIERAGVHLSLPLMMAAALGGHGLKSAAAIPLGLALQNRQQIAGRLLYNPAQEAQLAARMMLTGVPVLAAPGREVVEGR